MLHLEIFLIGASIFIASIVQLLSFQMALLFGVAGVAFTRYYFLNANKVKQNKGKLKETNKLIFHLQLCLKILR